MKKIKLTTILWVVFAFVILIEAFVLYRAIFAPADAAPETTSAAAEADKVNIDPAELSGLQSWLNEHQGSLPAAGTPNPFAEYK